MSHYKEDVSHKTKGISILQKMIVRYIKILKLMNFYHIILKRLNEQEETIKELNKYCVACDDTLTTIQELTYKLLIIDFGNAKSKADYCRLLNELDNKDLSFIHDCIMAINKCDLMRMEELKREYGDFE